MLWMGDGVKFFLSALLLCVFLGGLTLNMVDGKLAKFLILIIIVAVTFRLMSHLANNAFIFLY
jgi:hypothetical protein